MLLLERGADEALRDIGGHTAKERAGSPDILFCFYKEQSEVPPAEGI